VKLFAICMFLVLFGELYRHIHRILALSLNGWWVKLVNPKDLWTHVSSSVFVKFIGVNLCLMLNWDHLFIEPWPKHQQGANLRGGVC
jgi:hypothetical protein